MKIHGAIPLVLLLTAAALAEVGAAEPIVISVDFDGDGIADLATLTQNQTRVLLSVTVNSRAPQQFEFGVGPAAQNAVCTVPVTLTTSPLACRPDGPEDEPLPGCTESPSKVDLTIEDGDCDAIHVYWNQDIRQMMWWRR